MNHSPEPPVFHQYAGIYDLVYREKDYTAEADYVLRLARSHMQREPKSLLDMGCGTGRHLEAFAASGLQCDGFDRSPEMLEKAAVRLKGVDVDLQQGDLTTFRNGKAYDVVVSMFAVMGYLVSNKDLLSGLQTACSHLKPGGVFVFDGWFGPAVLMQKPEARRQAFRDGDRQVVREVTPVMDVSGQVVTVNYEVRVIEDEVLSEHIRESHRMRFMFVQEMALALEQTGMRLLQACPFMSPGDVLDAQTWNVSFVATRKNH